MNQNPNIGPNQNVVPNQPNSNNQKVLEQGRPNPVMPNQPNGIQQYVNNQNQPGTQTKKKKKGLSKELVTIVGVILIVGILYFSYNYTLNKNLEISANIPVAATKIKPGHKITQDDIKYIDVPASTLRTIGALTSVESIVNKYVLYDTIIPESSFFYESVLSESDQSPDSIFEILHPDEVAVTMDVDLKSTYGNSIMPGNKIDIYVKADRQVNGKIEYIVGPLISNVAVVAVTDGNGNHVFADHENKGVPSLLMFAVKPEISTILFKAQRLGNTEYGMELFPVVNGKYNIEGYDTVLNENEIKELIENATVAIQDNTFNE